MVYLDLSHLPSDYLDRRLKGIMDIYQTFYGDDPRKVPMKIFPAVHYFMGGIHVNWEHQTKIPGLFAAGECDYMYHGANRLGANSLLSAMYSGTVAGPAVVKYVSGLNSTAEETIGNQADLLVRQQQAEHEKLCKMEGKENPYKLHDEMSEIMYRNATIVRVNKNLEETDVKLQEFQERWKDINITDFGGYSNQTVMYVRQLRGMMDLARVIVGGALRRNESRGSHYKPEFPKRDDENFLKTTLATYKNGNPEFSYEDVDISWIKPVERKY
jgi:succinate dehydrogenase / fumarate reductase flavoprotein subunit